MTFDAIIIHLMEFIADNFVNPIYSFVTGYMYNSNPLNYGWNLTIPLTDIPLLAVDNVQDLPLGIDWLYFALGAFVSITAFILIFKAIRGLGRLVYSLITGVKR